MKETTEYFKGGSGQRIKHVCFYNQENKIVACLYILPNGNLHADSWICAEGWGNKYNPQENRQGFNQKSSSLNKKVNEQSVTKTTD